MGPTDILLAILGIALLFLVVAAFYESLAKRDVYVAPTMRAAGRRTTRRSRLALVYVATVGSGIPLLLVVWAIVLAIALVLVGSVDRAANAGLVAVLVVGAARVLAYAREKSAQELSKAIPLSLAFLLITGGALGIDQKLERLREARPVLEWARTVTLVDRNVAGDGLGDNFRRTIRWLARLHGEGGRMPERYFRVVTADTVITQVTSRRPILDLRADYPPVAKPPRERHATLTAIARRLAPTIRNLNPVAAGPADRSDAVRARACSVTISGRVAD